MEMFLLLTLLPVGLIGTLYWLEHDTDAPEPTSDGLRSRRRKR